VDTSVYIDVTVSIRAPRVTTRPSRRKDTARVTAPVAVPTAPAPVTSVAVPARGKRPPAPLFVLSDLDTLFVPADDPETVAAWRAGYRADRRAAYCVLAIALLVLAGLMIGLAWLLVRVGTDLAAMVN
jgi:hypothetical protein